MPHRPRPAHARGAVVVPLAAALALTGCATGHLEDYNAVPMGNAAPATAASTVRPEGGAVVPVGGPVRALVATGGEGVAVQLDAPPRLLFGTVDGEKWTPGRTVGLPADAATAVPGRDGGVLVPFGDGVVVVDSSGADRRLGGMGRVTAATWRDADTLVTGRPGGEIDFRGADGASRSTLKGMAAVDQLVAAGGGVMALSRVDTTVATVTEGSSEAGPTLRAGKAAGLAEGEESGRAVVSDTTGDALLVYTASPVRLHQMFPVGDAPWAVAADTVRQWVWVTMTGDDSVVGYDLDGGVGVRRGGFRTVHRPESVVVTGAGTVVVGSADGGGLHLVRPETDR